MAMIHSSWIVFLSLALAAATAFTWLAIAEHEAEYQRELGWPSLVGAACVLGLGLWGVHVLAMLSMHTEPRYAYDLRSLLAGLLSATTAMALALAMGRRMKLSGYLQALRAALIAAGCALLYVLSMRAISVAPPSSFDPSLLTMAVLVAGSAAYCAWWAAFARVLQKNAAGRGAAALAIGALMACASYTAVSATNVSVGAHVLSGTLLDSAWFPMTLTVFVAAVLALAVLIRAHTAYVLRHTRDLDRAHESARYAMRHDPLTGLPNRLALVEAVEEAVTQARREQREFALLVLNVDRFKQINDSLGYEAGDALLCEMGRRLRGVLRRSDLLVRLAGDEFGVLARDLGTTSDIDAVIAKIQEVLHSAFSRAQYELIPSVSIGISVFPRHGEEVDGLIRNADAAMRSAKESALGSHQYYSAEMSAAANDRLTLEMELRRALELGQLELHYQPKVDIGTSRVRSAEALIRWRHPSRGLVPPNDFIPLAEDSGLIVPIGAWVLREACRQSREWIDAGMAPVRVAVNLSAKQFRQSDLIEVVRSALRDARLEPGYLELELTESAVMHDAEKSAQTLAALSAMGVHISIDDFGTGYSSLSYLRRLPLDKLKIDRSFIRELLQNPDDVSIVKAIISLAHNLRLRVVAEGVETAEQLQFLRDLGCDQYQGFYCSPAVPPAEFAALVRRLRAERPEYTEADMLRTQSRLSAFTPAR